MEVMNYKCFLFAISLGIHPRHESIANEYGKRKIAVFPFGFRDKALDLVIEIKEVV